MLSLLCRISRPDGIRLGMVRHGRQSLLLDLHKRRFVADVLIKAIRIARHSGIRGREFCEIQRGDGIRYIPD